MLQCSVRFGKVRLASIHTVREVIWCADVDGLSRGAALFVQWQILLRNWLACVSFFFCFLFCSKAFVKKCGYSFFFSARLLQRSAVTPFLLSKVFVKFTHIIESDSRLHYPTLQDES